MLAYVKRCQVPKKDRKVHDTPSMHFRAQILLCRMGISYDLRCGLCPHHNIYIVEIIGPPEHEYNVNAVVRNIWDNPRCYAAAWLQRSRVATHEKHFFCTRPQVFPADETRKAETREDRGRKTIISALRELSSSLSDADKWNVLGFYDEDTLTRSTCRHRKGKRKAPSKH